MIAEDRPAKGTLRLRWANGDAGRVNLPSVAGVPLGRRRYVWLGPKVCWYSRASKAGGALRGGRAREVRCEAIQRRDPACHRQSQ
jgi:hypothetical protein